MPQTSTIKRSSRYDPKASLHPNATQARASDPLSSIWVSASAGTGKTKVLTDRVLRLLLPDDKGRPGTPAHTILCITFTKAAASEMQMRVLKTLSEWSVIADNELQATLKKLLGQEARADQLISARSLFTKIIDLPDGLAIMTIDSFCQSILARFPMEAGLEGSFKVMDEQERPLLLQQCLEAYLSDTADTPDLQRLSPLLAKRDIQQLLNSIIDHRTVLLSDALNPDALFQTLGDQPCATLEATYLETLAQRQDVLRTLIDTIAHVGSASNQDKYAPLRDWLNGSSPITVDIMAKIFLTTKREFIKKPAVKAVLETPLIREIIEHEQDCIHQHLCAIDNRVLAENSVLFTHFACDIIARYEAQKKQRNWLDFDDLVQRTAALLNHSDAQLDWVMFKLDGGVRHVMLDEAQDTNPDQWAILEALTSEFFRGEGVFEPGERSLFVVGDDKQSIYGFRGADPDVFEQRRAYFANKIAAAQQPFDTIDMTVSFRSGEAILDLVNSLLDVDHLRTAMTYTPRERLTHSAYRNGQAGQIDIWPLIGGDAAADIDLWADETIINQTQAPADQLADHIAQEIKNWLDQRQILPSRDRPIHAGDILILVNKRTSPIYTSLNRALQDYNIPVAGTDRIALSREMAVTDICAAMRFALLPHDDLTLAALLKSPFIGQDDAILMAHAPIKTGQFWSTLKTSTHLDQHSKEWLSELITKGAQSGPFALAMHILHTPCPTHHISGQSALKTRLGQSCLDGISEFLNKASHAQFQNRETTETFLHHLAQNTGDVKRETEEQGHALRMMTVHGAKGLQAPIIIMPDTIISDKTLAMGAGEIIWPPHTPTNTPLWMHQAFKPACVQQAHQQLIEKELHEYQRKLYVAVTRAEDRLLVCGAYAAQKPHEGSWYYSLAHALSTMDGVTSYDTPLLPAEHSPIDCALRLSYTQTAAPKTDQSAPISHTMGGTMPDWLSSTPPHEKADQRPLSPSRADEDAMPVAIASPLQQIDAFRFLRGNLTHALLQFLPDWPEQDWPEQTAKYLARHGAQLPPSTQQSIAKETLAILHDQQLADVFAPHSRAEVPVAGLVAGRAISGQIDRLVVRNDDVLIIDYKTNRPPPRHVDDVPLPYRKQMAAYQALLQAIYPDKKIRCFLLWTENAQIMELLDL